MREVLRPSGPPRCSLDPYNSGTGDNFKPALLHGADQSIHADRVARHVPGDHEIALGRLLVFHLAKPAVVDVLRKDVADPVLIIRRLHGAPPVVSGALLAR